MSLVSGVRPDKHGAKADDRSAVSLVVRSMQGAVPTVTERPAKCAIVGSVLHGARAKRVLVCRTSFECGRFRKRGFLREKGGMPAVF